MSDEAEEIDSGGMTEEAAWALSRPETRPRMGSSGFIQVLFWSRSGALLSFPQFGRVSSSLCCFRARYLLLYGK
jgi:hypothetical protein